LQEVKARALDRYYHLEEDCLVKKGEQLPAILEMLEVRALRLLRRRIIFRGRITCCQMCSESHLIRPSD
jgi:hypothetical protein